MKKKQKFRVLLKRFCSIMYPNKCMQLRNADTTWTVFSDTQSLRKEFLKSYAELHVAPKAKYIKAN